MKTPDNVVFKTQFKGYLIAYSLKYAISSERCVAMVCIGTWASFWIYF